jgi:GNAT superfamily N-acetyltransferase
MKSIIRPCTEGDFVALYGIINEAAGAYRGVIPPDCWKEPYMSSEELRREIEEGVFFYGYEEEGELIGVGGIQHVQEVTLIRHMYVLLERQREGIGSKLLSFLRQRTARPVLIGTWADAGWAIRFYENNGFRLLPTAERDCLLRKYWSVPERQIWASVVLGDAVWFSLQPKG